MVVIVKNMVRKPNLKYAQMPENFRITRPPYKLTIPDEAADWLEFAASTTSAVSNDQQRFDRFYHRARIPYVTADIFTSGVDETSVYSPLIHPMRLLGIIHARNHFRAADTGLG